MPVSRGGSAAFASRPECPFRPQGAASRCARRQRQHTEARARRPALAKPGALACAADEDAAHDTSTTRTAVAANAAHLNQGYLAANAAFQAAAASASRSRSGEPQVGQCQTPLRTNKALAPECPQEREGRAGVAEPVRSLLPRDRFRAAFAVAVGL